jgi:metallophosphoesterase (TIGR00282 family)
MSVRVLCIGDVVGRPARKLLTRDLSDLRDRLQADFVIANGENAAGGSGLTPKIFNELRRAGVDVVTSGDHIYKNKDAFDCIDEPRLLRPLNYVPAAAGHGLGTFPLDGSGRVTVVNLQGRVFMDPVESPFRAVDLALEGLGAQPGIVVVDMHGEATSEKIAMGWHLDGRVTAVVGTHTHVATADARVLPGGTAYQTDLGMTGPHDGVIGRRKEDILHHFTTGMPTRFHVCEGEVWLNGALIEVDAQSGKALAITRIQHPEPPAAGGQTAAQTRRHK